ncbi:large ribosomal subunit protein mL52 isoform X2 [Danaus plexippus]|uniref:Large ribosomal subunit protein mL52 n=1 Tax=Danaus plexippus plexippus TaxID=278856 RepID=A0A212FK45_DANPL|nr:large ribosomal subunit protein mL52 isoform X2 [Danaus plexippus]OWR54127.1 hypothetical protein KGM_210388 [Danaus plexippus plexippus]
MSAILTNIIRTKNIAVQCLVRQLSSTSSMNTKQWRLERGLPANRLTEGVLIDAPDYTYLDGRPTPLLQKQKKRMLRQQDYARQIIANISEIDFAKQRYFDNMKAAEEDRNNIINNRLKPKGKALLRKK